MRDSAVVRCSGAELLWYPPGHGGGPLPLQDAVQRAQLQQLLRSGKAPVIFAVPGTEVRLQQLRFSAKQKRHVAKSLPYTMEEEFASDIDELHFSSLPLREDKFAVAATEHARVAHWLALLEDFPGIKQWVPEPLLLPWREGELTLVVEAGLVVARFGEYDGFAVETELFPAMLAALDLAGLNALIIYGHDQAADSGLAPAELRDKLQWRQGGFGSALLLSREAPRALNLLQGRYGPKLPLDRWWRQWRWPAAALSTAFLLQVVAAYADYRQLDAENLRLRQDIETVYRLAVPEGAVADPERQLRNKLGQLRGSGQETGLLGLIEQVGQAVQAQPNTRIRSLTFSGARGDLRLNLLAPDFKVVEQLRSKLNQDGLQTTVESSNAEGSRVRARMKIQAGPL
ncbi:MAG: type II secretion system protein GspL [Halieaceae bacterium]|nr:type II secretion system protein GspL [Halieaceae bacterium]